MTGFRFARADLVRAVARHRALLAGGLAAGAVAAGLGVLAPAPTAGTLVLRAATDLPAGTSLSHGDLVLDEVATAALPAGALDGVDQAVGRLLAAPVRRGEVLTDVRVAGAALLGPDRDGRVAVPVRLADAASVALLRAGDRIDVLAASTGSGPAGGGAPATAVTVAFAAEVLAVPSTGGDGGEGALVVLSETPQTAARLAAAALSSRLSFTLRAAP